MLDISVLEKPIDDYALKSAASALHFSLRRARVMDGWELGLLLFRRSVWAGAELADRPVGVAINGFLATSYSEKGER